MRPWTTRPWTTRPWTTRPWTTRPWTTRPWTTLLAGLALALTAAAPTGCARCGADRPPAPPDASSPAPAAAAGPQVAVAVVWPAATPAEVEQGVTLVIEELLSGLPGVEGLRSTSAEGRSEVTARFAPGRDGSAARRAVADALRSAHSSFPEGAEQPLILPTTGGDSVTFVVEGDGDLPWSARRAWVERVREALFRTRGVAAVELCGVPEREVRVEVDEARLAALGIDARAVEAAVQAQVPAALVGGAGLGARGEAALAGLGDAMIAPPTVGAPVRLADIARIVDGPAAPTCVCLRRGHPTACGRVRFAPAEEPPPARTVVSRALAGLAVEAPPGVRAKLLPDAGGRLRLSTAEGLSDAAVARVRDTLAPALAPAGWLLWWDEAGARLHVPAGSYEAARAALDAVPGVAATPAEPPTVTLTLASHDLRRLREGADRLAAALAAVAGVRAARADLPRERPDLQIRPDRTRLARLGLSLAAVAEAVRRAHGARPAAIVPVGRSDVPIRVVVAPPVALDDPVALSWLPLVTPDGRSVPLAQVAGITVAVAPAAIHRRDGRRAVDIHVWAHPDAPPRLERRLLAAAEAASTLAPGEHLEVVR